MTHDSFANGVPSHQPTGSRSTDLLREAERLGSQTGRHRHEIFRWYFMRVSGVLLIVLALFHYFLTHIANDVAETTTDFVSDRWRNPWWRFYDWSLLALALGHGTNGLVAIFRDAIRNPRRRTFVLVLMLTIIVALFALGTWSIIVFDSDAHIVTDISQSVN